MSSLAMQRTLIDGVLLSLALGIILIGSMVYNARLWLQDYPKPIQEKVPPLSPSEKRDRKVVTILFLGALFGGIILKILQIRAVGGISFGVAYLHIFLMLFIFNLFDALVLDLLIITLLKPRFVILPGAEGMEYLFHDYRKHLENFLKGIAFCGVVSLPFALLAVI